jgi:hypothetical protein
MSLHPLSMNLAQLVAGYACCPGACLRVGHTGVAAVAARISGRNAFDLVGIGAKLGGLGSQRWMTQIRHHRIISCLQALWAVLAPTRRRAPLGRVPVHAAASSYS